MLCRDLCGFPFSSLQCYFEFFTIVIVCLFVNLKNMKAHVNSSCLWLLSPFCFGKKNTHTHKKALAKKSLEHLHSPLSLPWEKIDWNRKDNSVVHEQGRQERDGHLATSISKQEHLTTTKSFWYIQEVSEESTVLRNLVYRNWIQTH